VTLIPNIRSLNPSLTLVDLPGNKDRRSEVEVMMVSFVLNVCFRYAAKAKFIIVITNNGFKSSDGTEFINSICAFMKLFPCKDMSTDELKNVYQSVSLLITSVPIPQGINFDQVREYYL